jgi:hypothetical protein
MASSLLSRNQLSASAALSPSEQSSQAEKKTEKTTKANQPA